MYFTVLSKRFLPVFCLSATAFAMPCDLFASAWADAAASQNILAQATEQPKRPKPTFFEEERKLQVPTIPNRDAEATERSSTGFTSTFLFDATYNVSDPLTGVTTGSSPTDSFQKSSGSGTAIDTPSTGIFQTLPPRP